MPTVGMHGCGCVRGDIIVGWDTGRRQEASLMVVVGRVCRTGQQKTDKKQDLATRDKGGHSSHGCSRGA